MQVKTFQCNICFAVIEQMRPGTTGYKPPMGLNLRDGEERRSFSLPGVPDAEIHFCGPCCDGLHDLFNSGGAKKK